MSWRFTYKKKGKGEETPRETKRDTDFSPDQNDFINNTVSLNRKVTVILNSDQVERNLNTFSEDSLDVEEDVTIRSLDLAEGEGSCSLTDVSGEEVSSSAEVRLICSNITQSEQSERLMLKCHDL